MQFAVRAIRRMEFASLTLEAADAADARAQVERQGYSVVGVASATRRLGRSASRGAAFPLLQFNQSLLILLKAGLSVVEAIETLADRETRADAKLVLARLHEQMRVGLSFSAALEAQPGIFPSLYVAGVRANEKTGAVAEAISRFIAYRSQADIVRKRIVGAAIYPSIILGVGALVIAFLLLYVVPRFSVVFQDMGDRVPYLSRLLLQWGRFAQGHWLQMIALAAIVVGAAAYSLSRPAVRASLMRQVQRIPRIGEYLRVYQLARFYRALGMLLQAGIPIVAALDMVSGLLPASLHRATLAGGTSRHQRGPLDLCGLRGQRAHDRRVVAPAARRRAHRPDGRAARARG